MRREAGWERVKRALTLRGPGHIPRPANVDLSSICVNFGLNEQFNGPGNVRTNVRMDDTNPLKESPFYVSSIVADVRWLVGEAAFPPEVRATSGYFDEIHECAVELIEAGLAYVDSSTPEQVREGVLKRLRRRRGRGKGRRTPPPPFFVCLSNAGEQTTPLRHVLSAPRR